MALQDGLRPDPVMTVSEWAATHRILDSTSSSEAGLWRNDRTPYLRQPMDQLSTTSPATKVVLIKGAQLGGTEAGLNWCGYVIDHAPGPMLAVQPVVSIAKLLSQQRIDPMIEASDRLRAKIPPSRRRDSKNTALSKSFPGGILRLTGANSAKGLRSMPARYLFLDEVDAYPLNLQKEGDPVALAEKRTNTYGRRRKVLMVSTPTIKGMSRIEREFELTDKRYYFMPCPHCGLKQVLKFERLKWNAGEPDSVRYDCAGCEGRIYEHHKTAMLAGGEWRATAKSKDPLTVGYHISSLYSPVGWLSWAQIARDWEAAQGSEEAIQTFKNTILGETYAEPGEAPDAQRLYERRESYLSDVVPTGGLFLTAGVDVQPDRLECSVWAWGRGMQSWLISHDVILTGPKNPESWQRLEEILNQSVIGADGRTVFRIRRMAVDTGYDTQTVYSWARKLGDPRIMPIKGEQQYNRPNPVTGPKHVDVLEDGRRISRGARLWKIAVATFKSETYRWLRSDVPKDGKPYPHGFIHVGKAAPLEFFEGLTGENLTVRKDARGFNKFIWVKTRRNEPLDCRVYARAAVYALGVDFWPEHRWAKEERKLGIRHTPPDLPVIDADADPVDNEGDEDAPVEITTKAMPSPPVKASPPPATPPPPPPRPPPGRPPPRRKKNIVRPNW